MKEGTSLVKDKVPNRISAAELRERWGRVVKHDFINVILETKMNIYLRSEVRPENVLRSKRFYSQFFPQQDRTNILFDKRCFFNLDQVEEVEQKYPRLWAGEHSVVGKLNLEIEELKKEVKSYQTKKARLTLAQKKLNGAQKEGFFLANMMLEMVKDPTPQKQFSHEEYQAIANNVKDKQYIQKLELVRPANTLIELSVKIYPQNSETKEIVLSKNLGTIWTKGKPQIEAGLYKSAGFDMYFRIFCNFPIKQYPAKMCRCQPLPTTHPTQ